MARTQSKAVDIDSPGSRVLFCLLFGGATAIYFVLPIWAGLFEEDFGFSATQIGWLLSADMSSNTLAILASRFWLHRVHFRHAILGAVMIYMIGNLACLGVTEFTPLLLLRYLTGIGMGTLAAVSAAGIGATSKPDRNFGFALSAQVTIGGVLLFSTPYLVGTWSIESYFVVFSVIMGSVLLFLRFVPDSYEKEHVSDTESGFGLSVPLMLSLAGVVLFFIGMNGFWSFVERIADQGGIDTGFVSMALAVSVLVSVLGSLLAAWMSDRFGRIGPITIGLSITIGSVLLLIYDVTSMLFFVSINIFNWMYNFIIPFQSGWVADLDTTGRNITVLPAVQGGGISLGPIIAGTLISGTDYFPVMYISTLFLIVSGVTYFVLYFLVDGRPRSTSTTVPDTASPV